MTVPTLLRNWVDPLPTFVSDALEDTGDPFAKRLSIFESTALSDLGWTREDELTGSWIIWSNSPLNDSKTFFRFDTGDPSVSDIGSFTTDADIQGSCVIVRSYPSLPDAQNKTNLIFADLLRIAEDDDRGSSTQFQPYMIIGNSRGFYFFPGVQDDASSGLVGLSDFTIVLFTWLQYVGELPTFSGTPAGSTIIGGGTMSNGAVPLMGYDQSPNGLNSRITGAIDGAASEVLSVIRTKSTINFLGETDNSSKQGPSLEFWSPVLLRGNSTNQLRATLPGLMDPILQISPLPAEGTTERTLNTPTGLRQGVVVPISNNVQTTNFSGALFFDTESDWDLYHVF